MIEAVQHFHQSAFARAVLAEQREHFAGADLKIDVVVGDDGAELLANAGHRDEGGRHSRSSQGENAVHFDGRAARQIGDADGGTGVTAVRAEQLAA